MQEMIGDNMGTNGPWYDDDTYTFPNRMYTQTTTVSMQDNPCSSVDWWDPANDIEGNAFLITLSGLPNFHKSDA